MQLAGTVDVICSPWVDWLHGGLQYQTVHHLYPRLPRFALRRVSSEVAEAAAKSSIVYHRETFYQANVLVIQTLHATALKCASAPLATGPGAPLLWDALNARG